MNDAAKDMRLTTAIPRIYLVLAISCLLICATTSFAENINRELPNILLAISDDQSFPHASAYGCEWVSTPAFDEIARRGILFTNCYTPNAKCAPSRSCLVTGRYPWRLEEAANHASNFPKRFKTYCEALVETKDYFVGFTGKGVQPVKAPGRQLTGMPWNRKKTAPLTTGISINDYSANFADFLEARPEGVPFCFWYGGHEPHRRYEYGTGSEQTDKSPKALSIPAYWPDTEEVRKDVLDYAYEIEHFDRHLGKMLRILEEQGELENTIIIVTSDNGMPFPRCKGTAYETSVHLPLAVMWPAGITNPGRVVNDFVSLVDVAPTLLEVVGHPSANTTGMETFDGRSLLSIFNSDRSGRVDVSRDHAILGQERHDVGRPNDVGYPIRGIVKDDWLYLQNFEPDRWPMCDPITGYLNTDGSPTKTAVLDFRRKEIDPIPWQLCFGKRVKYELYSLKNDPDCLKNLADDSSHDQSSKQLHTLLMDNLSNQGDPRLLGKGEEFDSYPYANPAYRNYYNRFIDGEQNLASPNWVSPTDFEQPSDADSNGSKLKQKEKE